MILALQIPQREVNPQADDDERARAQGYVSSVRTYQLDGVYQRIMDRILADYFLTRKLGGTHSPFSRGSLAKTANISQPVIGDKSAQFIGISESRRPPPRS